MRGFKHITIAEPRADAAGGDAPIPPPAAQATSAQLNIVFGDRTTATARIARRRNRLRLVHLPAARTWARRVARTLLSHHTITRRPTS